jgi:hypothetical protein
VFGPPSPRVACAAWLGVHGVARGARTANVARGAGVQGCRGARTTSTPGTQIGSGLSLRLSMFLMPSIGLHQAGPLARTWKTSTTVLNGGRSRESGLQQRVMSDLYCAWRAGSGGAVLAAAVQSPPPPPPSPFKTRTRTHTQTHTHTQYSCSGTGAADGCGAAMARALNPRAQTAQNDGPTTHPRTRCTTPPHARARALTVPRAPPLRRPATRPLRRGPPSRTTHTTPVARRARARLRACVSELILVLIL